MPELGLFDYLTPVYQSIDGIAARWLAEEVRLVLWCIFLIGLPIAIVRLLLTNEKFRLWQLDLQFYRQLQNTFKSLKQSPRLNHKRFWRLWLQLNLMRLPIAILCVYLFIGLLSWMSLNFAYRLPKAGEWVPVKPIPERVQAPSWSWQPRENAIWSEKLQAYVIRWPGTDQKVTMYDQAGNIVFQLQPSQAGPVLTQFQLVHYLMANPAGYLGADTSIQEIRLELDEKRYLPWGGDWMGQWWVVLCLIAFVYLLYRIWSLWRRPAQDEPGKVLSLYKP